MTQDVVYPKPHELNVVFIELTSGYRLIGGVDNAVVLSLDSPASGDVVFRLYHPVEVTLTQTYDVRQSRPTLASPPVRAQPNSPPRQAFGTNEPLFSVHYTYLPHCDHLCPREPVMTLRYDAVALWYKYDLQRDRQLSQLYIAELSPNPPTFIGRNENV